MAGLFLLRFTIVFMLIRFTIPAISMICTIYYSLLEMIMFVALLSWFFMFSLYEIEFIDGILNQQWINLYLMHNTVMNH